jgi:hypothetical protein
MEVRVAKTSGGAPNPFFLMYGVLVLLLLPGGLVIRTTEHRVRLNKDGSGDAVVKLIDIRSDGVTDSAVVHDFEVMMASFEKSGVEDFEKAGRKVTEKVMYTRGDTLCAEISYAFQSLDAIEGLRITPEEMFVIVAVDREIVRTNGKISKMEENSRKIAWSREASWLAYMIRERHMPPSAPLGSLYNRWRSGR